MLQDNNGNACLRMDDVTNGISERLLQLLWDQDDKDIEQLGSNEDRSMAIARKTAFLAQTDPSKRKFDARLVYLDPQKIAFYVLRDLFLRYPSYAMSDLLQKWEARLPMSETFEKCLTVEWLQEQRLVPDQLVLEDVDNASGITSSTSSSSLGKVIRLASSDTVLAWKES
ncbi:hypothetical protein IV203_018575 [Nitzschia inconspicua]|uniref:Uncharacterized protein n=1 Tax=Nitzschia inconspicua TaxID=303405 RepID=A0A9K3K5N5_9STRA|nr:hypothetical protein IV203_033385 [Nitzschia inconspicua]KAG7372432.1 hypothetical protein IV203_018575 [Nitzschia inconspicua]